MLFNPFEEKFNLPSAFVEVCNHCWSKFKIVAQVHIRLTFLRIEILDASHWLRVFFCGFRASKRYGLITSNTGRFINGTRVLPFKTSI